MNSLNRESTSLITPPISLHFCCLLIIKIVIWFIFLILQTVNFFLIHLDINKNLQKPKQIFITLKFPNLIRFFNADFFLLSSKHKKSANIGCVDKLGSRNLSYALLRLRLSNTQARDSCATTYPDAQNLRYKYYLKINAF